MAGKRVLVVDDDQRTVELVKLYLNRDGYRVLTAHDGVEALRLARQYEGEIHLLVADVVLPGGMSGQEVAEQLSKDRPNLKVLYISAYADDEIADHGILGPGINFCQNPSTWRI